MLTLTESEKAAVVEALEAASAWYHNQSYCLMKTARAYGAEGASFAQVGTDLRIKGQDTWNLAQKIAEAGQVGVTS